MGVVLKNSNMFCFLVGGLRPFSRILLDFAIVSGSGVKSRRHKHMLLVWSPEAVNVSIFDGFLEYLAAWQLPASSWQSAVNNYR